jgi:hypothetical protein
MNSERPDSPEHLTALAMSAIATHELYESYRNAGFTDDQALQLTMALIVDHQQRRGNRE